MFAKHTKDMTEDEISSFFTNRSPQKPKKGGSGRAFRFTLRPLVEQRNFFLLRLTRCSLIS